MNEKNGRVENEFFELMTKRARGLNDRKVSKGICFHSPFTIQMNVVVVLTMHIDTFDRQAEISIPKDRYEK